jgi:UDP-N-acetylglucosamine--N-acetylmuramyl-(pentapeptide) pyrophosphoryl-undecaprenol N-acetylglucosamine transferase
VTEQPTDDNGRRLSVVLAGGGTAGHVEPALAVADALRRRDPDVRVTALGTAAGLETTLVPARGYDLRLIPRVPLPRRPSRDWVTLGPRLAGAVTECRRVLRSVSADVVVGFGGYVSLPAYLAARRMGIPIVVHEANARPGLANRVGARLTRWVAVSAADTRLPHATVTGLPLRRSIAALDRAALRPRARERFQLDPQRTTLLVFGGSQGAQRINTAIAGAARGLLDAGVQVLHAAGPGNEVVVDSRADDPPYVVVPYLEEMDLAYAAADLVVSRSGAMTCAELAAVGLPAVFVPYPWSNGEQEVNALPLVRQGAAQIVPDEQLTAARALEVLLPLLTDEAALGRRASAARGSGHPDADDRVADLVLQAVGEQR